MYVLRCLLTLQLFLQRRSRRRVLALLASFLLLSMSAAFAPVYAATKATPIVTWHTFHDPIYGFSLMYPSTWTLTTERDGSHITLLNPTTQTTISPIVTTQTGTPATILKQALPAYSIGKQTRFVAGHQGIDYLLPYIPQPKNQDAAVIGGPQQTRLVVVPVTNTASTINVYTFLLAQPTSMTGKVSAAEQADQRTFEAILNSFILAAKVVTSHVASATGCDRICWADANVDFADYTATSTVPRGSAQPNYQCAEFVARAITQDGMISGLNNGGANGNYSPASDDSTGGYGYGGYLANNGTNYHLWNVGVANPFTIGLHHYLTDSGLAINIGEDMSQVQPGDVIFFNNGSGTDYYHTMLIVAVADGGLYLDGHNVSQYHRFITSAQYAGDFDIYHFATTSHIPNQNMAVGRSQNGHLEALSGGSDNNIWDMVQSSANSNSWNSSTPLKPNYAFNGDPAIGSWQSQLQAFARGTDNNIWHASQTGANGPWNGWSPLQNGYAFQGTPAVANDANGNIEVFARGSDNRIWHNVYSNGWSGWSRLFANSFNGDPAVGSWHGQLQVFARGTDNNIWHASQNGMNGPWNGWTVLQSGYAFQGTASVANDANGNIEVFAHGSDNRIWHNAYSTNWSGWSRLFADSFNGDPAVGSWQGQLQVFARGTDDNIWHASQSGANGPWAGWTVLQSGYAFQGTASVANDANGNIEVFSRGSDNHIWHNFYSNGWSGWSRL